MDRPRQFPGHCEENFMPGDIIYLPGHSPSATEPLARYLPPVPEGIAAAWLDQQGLQGAWVLDPFGAAPRLALEMARSGHRVLVAANNPVARFLLEMNAQPPEKTALQAALADLASAFKGEERIEPHIRALYETECAQCHQRINADAFLWERGASSPYGKIYSCPHCHDSGEHPVTAADVERASGFTARGLHLARALERVAPPNDPDRSHAEEALSVYLPRAVYSLFTLINKLDGMALSPARRSSLQALLLVACDQANTLWPYPTARERPRQLTIPPRFRENNVWLALERAVDIWATGNPPVSLTTWPELPEKDGGICIFEGRLKTLWEQIQADAKDSESPAFQAVCAALPRPNQAFWTLSALWTGWLWGREAVGPFITVLRRRRYDWSWHTTALNAAMDHLAPLISEGTPFWGVIGETEPGFLSAALVAADGAGFELQGLALRAGQEQAQILWQRSDQTEEPIAGDADPAAQALKPANHSTLKFLQDHGEPARYLSMYTAALTGLAHARIFSSAGYSSIPEAASQSQEEPSPSRQFNLAQTLIRDVLTYRGGFLRYDPGESPESGFWWLRESSNSQQPLADRLEIALVHYIHHNPGQRLEEIDFYLCQTFPGLHTPDLDLVHICLESYAEQDPPDSGLWRLRSQDIPATRRADIQTVRAQLQQLGTNLGYTTQEETPVIWYDEAHQPVYTFFPIASAVLGTILLGQQPLTTSSGRAIIVLPGGRANLVAYKLRHDPRLHRLTLLDTSVSEDQAAWRFLKYRHLRWLLDNFSLINMDNLDAKLDLDPLTYTAPQIRLF